MHALKCPNGCDAGLQVVMTRNHMVPMLIDETAHFVYVTKEALELTKVVVDGSPFVECIECGYDFMLEVIVK